MSLSCLVIWADGKEVGSKRDFVKSVIFTAANVVKDEQQGTLASTTRKQLLRFL
jgi:hypothetical protein